MDYIHEAARHTVSSYVLVVMSVVSHFVHGCRISTRIITCIFIFGENYIVRSAIEIAFPSVCLSVCL